MSFSAASLSLAGLGFALAFVNGANDISKGISTLVGSGVADYRRAILWGTAWTAVGALVSAELARAMVATFGGGLISDGTTQTLAVAVATLSGAVAWLLIATRTGLPVSTTHAIVGSLVGVATVAYGASGVRWSALGGKVVLPLLLTPLLSLSLVLALLKQTQRGGSRGRSLARDCVCVEWSSPAPTLGASCAQAAPSLGPLVPEVTVDSRAACAASRPQASRLTFDHLHWLTAGATSFARGLNDAPKIVALLVAASTLGSAESFGAVTLFAVVTLGMVAGSLIAGRKVTRVLAENVTPMDHREGFFTNLVTAALVTLGATSGLPMSTTHVSSGGIIGAGAQRASLNQQTLRQILLAWVVTLPAAALLGVGSWLLVRAIL